MKAAVRDRYGPPEVIRVDEVAAPAPGAGEALVRVRAASLNTADSEHLRGMPRFIRLFSGMRRPRHSRMGTDVAGTVEAVGPRVAVLRPGDEVWADLFDHGAGALAEYVNVPAAALAPKPATATFEEAAAVPHSGVLAMQGLLCRGPFRAGEHVLINGAGGCVGPFAIQIAKAHGAEVTAVDHTDKLDLLRAAGADHTVDHTRTDVTDSPERYDRILDIVGNRSVLRWRRLLRPGGGYALIARDLSGFAGAAILGAAISVFGDRRLGVFGWKANRRRDLDELARLIDTGRIRPIVDRSFGLDQVADAYRHLESGRARGKVVVVLPESS